MKAEQVNVRRAKLRDISELVKLQEEFEIFYDSIDLSVFNPCRERKKNITAILKKMARKNIYSRKNLLLVAEDNGKIVGYAWSKVKNNNDFYKMKKIGKIEYIYILKEYRGNKISSIFKKNIFDWFEEKGAEWAVLDVHKNNSSAQKIYEKWGFGEFERSMWRRLK